MAGIFLSVGPKFLLQLVLLPTLLCPLVVKLQKNLLLRSSGSNMDQMRQQERCVCCLISCDQLKKIGAIFWPYVVGGYAGSYLIECLIIPRLVCSHDNDSKSGACESLLKVLC